jgi:excisionase family DNA binding protein
MQTDILANSSNAPTLGHDEWLTLQAAAAIVHIHESTLRREIRAGRLRYARVGGRKNFRLRRSWVDAWLEATSAPVEVRS